MIRDDFVSNSSSTSFIIKLTQSEFDKRTKHKREILDVVLDNITFREVGSPVDKRSQMSERIYRAERAHDCALSYNPEHKLYVPNIKNYDADICPYDDCLQTGDPSDGLIFTKKKIKEYLKCCNNCTSYTNCPGKSLLESMLKSLTKKGEKIFKFDIDSSDSNFYIDRYDIEALLKNDPKNVKNTQE